MHRSHFRLILIAAGLFLAPAVHAQTFGSPIVGGLGFQYFDNSGLPLANGKLCTYLAGTLTPLATYTDATLVTVNTDPVLLNAAGRPTSSGGSLVGVFIGAVQKYKIVALQGGDLTCSTGATIWTYDNITPAGAVSSVVGTTNQIIVTTSGGVATVSLPTNVITGEFTATNTGGALVFNSAKIQMDGNGFMNMGGVLTTLGGVVLSANSWNALNSLTDGGLLRGLAIAQNNAGTAGGYAVFGPILYPPNGGSTPCFDVNGNIVTQPTELTGGSPGPNDLFLWNSTSPQMPASGCGAALPVNTDYGLNTNGYFFGRGGLATDNLAYNAINTIYQGAGNPAGGVEAGTVIAGTLYPAGTATTTGVLGAATYLGGHMVMGHSTGVPAAGSISTTTNPLVQGEGLIQGMFFFNDTTGHPNYYNGSVWVDWTGGGGGSGCTPGGVHFSVQINDGAGGCTGDTNFTYTPTTSVSLGGGASFLTVGTSAGFNATTCTATNCIQAPGGGILGLTVRMSDSAIWVAEVAPALSAAGQARMYFDSGTFTLNCSLNGGAYGNCAGGGGGGGAPGAPTNSIQTNNGSGGFAGSSNLIYASNLVTLTSGSFFTVGTSAGFDASTCTATNCIQAPSGGILGLTIRTTDSVIWTSETAPPLSAPGQARQYFDSGTLVLECSFNGGAYGACASGGGSGVSSITGTTAQVLVNGTFGSPQTGAITLTLPQNIATSSSPTFAALTVNGAIGLTGVVTSTGVSGGFNVTGDTASNSIQTVGGVLSALGYNTGGSGVYNLNGTTVINASRDLVNIGSITSTGLLFVTGGGLFTSGVNAASVSGGSGGFFSNGNTGVSCSGSPSGSFASVNGIVTHC